MHAQLSENIEAFKIFIDFLTENMIIFLLMLFTYLCRNAINDLIKRLTNLTFRNGESEIGIAASQSRIEEKSEFELSSASEHLVTVENAVIVGIEEEAKKKHWFTAFDEGNIDDAKRIFKEYELNEQDENKLIEKKAFFLYILFVKGKDNTAITQLENMVESTKNENTRQHVLESLSLCYRESSQTQKEIHVWRHAIEKFSSENLANEAVINLALALQREGDVESAQKLLIEKLASIKKQSLKANIYSALAIIEKSKGNNKLSVYCKDLSLQYNPNNRDELFNSAFTASEENVKEISFSNYITLLNIDRNNAAALNNLGVLAKETGLEIKAVENYKKATNLKHTLAMSNLGYLFLNSGFVEEAEEIAKKASQMDNPNPTVYSLLSNINQKKEEQNKKWNELIEKYFKKQKQIRNYTEQFYLGSSDKLDGEWILNNNDEISININSASGIVNASWNESINKYSSDLAKVELTGNISGSTFTGFYKKNRENSNRNTALLMREDNINVSCIGFLSDDELVLNIVSDKQENDFSLSMYKKEKD